MNYNQNINYQVNHPSNQSFTSFQMSQHQMVVPINSQTSPSPEEISALNQSLRTNPVFITCPGCRVQGPSKVMKSISLLNFFYWLCCPCCWSVSKNCGVKEYNCFDVNHYCHKCGISIGKYEAC
jgi:hypothetical protein